MMPRQRRSMNLMFADWANRGPIWTISGRRATQAPLLTLDANHTDLLEVHFDVAA